MQTSEVRISEAGPVRAERRPVAFAALRHSAYRPFFGTSIFSMMADNIEHVITYWVMFQVFHSPWLGGFAVISHWTPHLFAVYVGYLADRFDCRKLIFFGQMLFILASSTWAFLIATEQLAIWHAVILLVVHGLAGVFWNVGTQVIIHDVVGSADLPSAVRMNSTGRQLGLLFGPAVGGALLLTVGPAVGMVVNAMFFVPFTIWLLRSPFTGHLRDSETGKTRREMSFSELAGAVRDLSRYRPIMAMVSLAGIGSLLVGNAYTPQLPQFAADLVAGQSELHYTALLGASAAGAVIGGLILEGGGLLKPRPRSAMVTGLIWAGSLVGFAATNSYPLALLMLFITGFASLATSSMGQTIVQLEAPSALRGRAVGLYSVASSGLRVGSGLSIGFLGGLVGIHASLGLSAALVMLSIVALALFVVRPRPRQPAVA